MKQVGENTWQPEENGRPSRTETTVNGKLSFTGLQQGWYFLQEEAQSAYQQVQPIPVYMQTIGHGSGVFRCRIDEVKGMDPSVVYDDSYWIAEVTIPSPAMPASITYQHYSAEGELMGIGVEPSFENKLYVSVVPPTGDDSMPLVWLGAMLLSMGCASLLLILRRRQHG